ncbi:MAG: polysaccharide deacetylase family protein [Acidimicrobiales bacterium]|nr:polysaccharide deacetylase family protein [Acidimicrobiales bacterium]MCB1016431.1 polysaccharide deacetylase family protein [Acidimicrobiales bacterium]MCB9373737.1 polysaccharide deacetylase family protein [Microthrixaceae bacterium]
MPTEHDGRPAAVRAPVTFSFDVEPHRPDPADDTSYPVVTRRVYEWLAERGIRGTVFVVGTTALANPALVTEAVAAGHEVGLHSWDHTPLTELSPERFTDETRRGKALLEDLVGEAIVGYRAPTFSLVRRNVWVTDVLAELGFTYSSSVLPARSPLHGFPGLPREPFTWPSGLVELPCPIARLGPLAMPFLGGVYLRVLPWPLVSLTWRVNGGGPAPLTYCHPYDFDTDEPFWVVPGTGRLGSRLLWIGRGRMFAKLERLFAHGAGPPLRELLHTADPVGAHAIPGVPS